MDEQKPGYSSVPRVAEKWLTWSMPRSLHEPVLGDLWETYQLYAKQYGPFKARLWYIKQTLKSSLRFILRYKRGMMMFLLSLAVFVGVTFMAMLLGGELSMFVNWPSAVIVLPVSVAFAIATTSIEDFKRAFSIAISDGHEWTEKQYRSAEHVFDMIGNSAVMMGWFGVLLGAIAMASHITKDSFADVFGPATAVCLLTIFYGYAIKIVCFTATQRIKHFSIVNQ